MKFLRNPEILRAVLTYVILSAAASVFAFAKSSEWGFFVLILCIAFTLIYIVTTYERYKKISALSSDLNRILHGKKSILIRKYSEGELSILQSEIRKMTVRLREQQRNLQNDKLYLADSIADISHQIKTPLTSINLLVSFLSEHNLSEEKRVKYTHELYVLLSRIEWLITTLLKMSKLDAGTVEFKKETVTVSELLSKSTEPLLVPIELRGQELHISAEGSFYGDISWTSEAISNIVKNCMEHTENGGKICITACENTLYTEIIIEDNGSGIDKEDLPHIFERFYKGKNSDEKSFGIGLALARTIISSQNGTVKAENKSDRGAKFTIRFYKGTV